MQNIKQQQQAAKLRAKHYKTSAEFMGMVGPDWDEEVEVDGRWLGMLRDEDGMLHVHAEFVWDKGKDSGWGWWL